MKQPEDKSTIDFAEQRMDFELAARIWRAASRSLGTAYAAHKNFTHNFAPVNWSDLGVTDVRYWAGMSGEDGWQVIIEEAAPENVELQNFIRQHMSDVFGIDPELTIEIVTEW